MDISDYTNSDFKIRFIVLASKSSEDVGVDEIVIRATSETSQSGIFSDNFENGLDKWTTSGELEWETGTLDENFFQVIHHLITLPKLMTVIEIVY